MAITVFPTNSAYVEALRDVEEHATQGPVLLASSYLSSAYVPEPVIQRYFKAMQVSEQSLIHDLLARQEKWIHSLHRGRREIYEAQVFTNLIGQGIVHTQEPDFRLRPAEIVETLRRVI